MSAFQKLLSMYEEELYTSVHTLSQFYLTNPPFFYLSPSEIFSVHVLNAIRYEASFTRLLSP